MALIRCPQCDTLHDVEGSFFDAGPRKVRCAECRTVWEANDPDRVKRQPIVPTLELKVNPPEMRAAEAKKANAAFEEPAIDFALPAETRADENHPDEAAISAEELEALFADEAKPVDPPAAATGASREPLPGFDSPIIVPQAAANPATPPAAGEDEP